MGVRRALVRLLTQPLRDSVSRWNRAWAIVRVECYQPTNVSMSTSSPIPSFPTPAPRLVATMVCRIPKTLRLNILIGVVGLLVSGCTLSVADRGNAATLRPDRPGRVLVCGRVNYVIDGHIKTPYGPFRPRWHAPVVVTTRLESGYVVSTPFVANRDGSFLWEMLPGHYVITRIGVGQFTDDTYIAWPRVAFEVPAQESLVYLGHLVLAGTSRTNDFTYSTGRTSRTHTVEYQFEVRDEMAEHLARLHPADRSALSKASKSLMFHDTGMPIGDKLAEQWRHSRHAVIEDIFGRAGH